MIFIYKTSVVESHPTARKIRDLLQPRSTPTGNMIYFYIEQLGRLHTANTSNVASNEDIMENNYIFVMLWNLSVISHWIFSQCFFFLAQNLKYTSSKFVLIIRIYFQVYCRFHGKCKVSMAEKSYPIRFIENSDEDVQTRYPNYSKSVPIPIYYDSGNEPDHNSNRATSGKRHQKPGSNRRNIPTGSIERILSDGRITKKGSNSSKSDIQSAKLQETTGVDQKPESLDNSRHENKLESSDKKKRTRNRPSLCWTGKAGSSESEDSDAVSKQPASPYDNGSDSCKTSRRDRVISEQSVRDSYNRLEAENMGFHIIEQDEIPDPEQCLVAQLQQQPSSKRSFCAIL